MWVTPTTWCSWAGTGGLVVRNLGPGLHEMNETGPLLINAGSVGQPRDGDNRAKYLIWEPENRTLEARFISYDIRKTAEAIIAAGMPGYTRSGYSEKGGEFERS